MTLPPPPHGLRQWRTGRTYTRVRCVCGWEIMLGRENHRRHAIAAFDKHVSRHA